MAAKVVYRSALAARARRWAGDTTSPVFAVSLPGVIHVDGDRLPEDLRAHEEIHQRQWKRWGYVLYPFRYGAEMAWLMARLRRARLAYLAHSMEREAYGVQQAWRAAHGLPPLILA